MKRKQNVKKCTEGRKLWFFKYDLNIFINSYYANAITSPTLYKSVA